MRVPGGDPAKGFRGGDGGERGTTDPRVYPGPVHPLPRLGIPAQGGQVRDHDSGLDGLQYVGKARVHFGGNVLLLTLSLSLD